jgi:hypothetical protein
MGADLEYASTYTDASVPNWTTRKMYAVNVIRNFPQPKIQPSFEVPQMPLANFSIECIHSIELF